MGKSLIIAEKPSVATDLVRVLSKDPKVGAFSKEKDYFESDHYIVSSAIGHLVELALPGSDGKGLKWKIDNLPILPEEFELQPIERSEARFKLLRRLMRRKDVTGLINACDAGREGELIFRYVVAAAKVDKPVRRLWMQSMTPQAIREAFSKLRPGEELQPLYDAAMCRSESDWLVGINSTRALTAFNSRHGGFNLTPVGRVQTPTLAILVKRELEIQKFTPRDYWEVHAEFGVEGGSYAGRWFQEGFKKPADNEHARAERLWERAQAEAVVARCEGKTGVVEEKKKPSKQAAPLLYDLTSLQREASNRFGFSAGRTLQLAQALYERHKVLTYPRTDSRFLPDDYLGTVKRTIGGFADLSPAKLGSFPSDLVDHAEFALKQGYVRPNRRIFDNSKVSDHFAIIPTGQVPTRSLGEAEQKLFDMVARRFIAVFYPAAEFELTSRITRVGDDAFKTDGKILVVAGWQAVYGKRARSSSDGDDDKTLVAVKPGEPAEVLEIEVQDLVTKPPPRYTEATLLSMMEGAGKLVDDDELRSAMSDRGLGTPATRAAIIDGLIKDKYINREKRDLIATAKGIQTIGELEDIGVEVLSSPEMTGNWEFKLRQIQQGEFDRDSFMREIRQLTTDIVERTRSHFNTVKNRVLPDLEVDCPSCGARPLKQDDQGYRCQNPECRFRIFRTIAGRTLTEPELKTLLTERLVGPIEGFRSRRGALFSAVLELRQDDNGKLAAGFVFDKDPADELTAADLGDEQFVCEAPDNRGRIYATETSYVCLRPDGKTIDDKLRLPRELCKFQLSPEQARKFFTEGKTDLIDKFISKRGRPFSARLALDLEGKRLIQWEFPPREKKDPATKKAATKKKRSAKKKTARRSG